VVTQQALWHECPEDALGAVVQALGGPKAVGAQLWPEKAADEAGRLLRHCLSADRSEKLSLEQILWLLKAGREVNAHEAMTYLLRTCGYNDPEPVDPQDEQSRLLREFLDMGRRLEQLAKRMEKLNLVRAA